MALRRWVVTVASGRALTDVASALAGHGFTDMQLHDQIGVIVGAAEEDVADDARAVSGVLDVSPEGQVDVGPPDAPLSW
ncbi:hypothetical protein ABT324_02330 [Saccharopolyspora sp. NPDC000359]|uniref:hypothetical protein n=1 Tax=Saccharopolyspora sp. NPDC000359 TaxID=3154251 RepID=UPI00331E8816